MKSFLFIFVIFFSLATSCSAQCCGGGSAFSGGLADGSSQGLLAQKQFEAGAYFQYYFSNRLKTADFKEFDSLSVGANFQEYSDQFAFLRFAYGVSDRLSVFTELGYYFYKTEKQVNDFELTGAGIGDLLILPKYSLFIKEKNFKKMELIVGLGMKIPTGEYDQTYVAYVNPIDGSEFELVKSPSSQPGSGANDLIFTSSFLHSNNTSGLYMNATANLVLRGANPLGYKFGNMAQLSVFAGLPVASNLYVMTQLKGEIQGAMTDVFDVYSGNTGNKKVFVIPYLSYTLFDRFTLQFSSQIPLYQYMNGTQLSSQKIYLAGISFRPLSGMGSSPVDIVSPK